MKILSVNQSDIGGGAARAAYRVARQLVLMKVDLKMQVMRKLGDDPWVSGPKTMFQSVMSRALPRLDMLAQKYAGVRPGFSWSLNRLPNPALDKKFINSFDVVHLHWVGKNMLPVNWLKNIEKPIAWTLHDTWPFTGACHTPFDCRKFEESCGNCPQLSKNNAGDESRKLWIEKFEAYKLIDLHIIAPSKWVAQEAGASSLLKTRPISVIPNGLDTNIFTPTEKFSARRSLNLPMEKRILLFGAMAAFTDRNKGLSLLFEALSQLKERDPLFASKTILVIFGTGSQSSDSFPIPTVQLGLIQDDAFLARVYSSADLTIVPSTVESFGQVASESLSCGTPVVAFNTTGLKDVVDHLKTGYLASPFRPDDLSSGIEFLLNQQDKLQEMSVMARLTATSRFDIRVTTKAHLDLFENLAAKNM